MFAVTHTASALLIAEKIYNPWWIFIIGIISHYFLDLIPHGDRLLEKGLNDNGEIKKRAIKRLIYVTIVDLIITAILIVYFFTTSKIINPYNTALAIFAVLLPDTLMGLGKMTYIFNFPNPKNFFVKLNLKLYRLHYLIHEFIPGEMPIWQGLILQIFITALFLYFSNFF